LTTDVKTNHFRATIIFLLAATFYLYEFTLQVSPSVMTTPLMADLHIHAAGLGTMAAFYFYAYAPMQIPGGLLFDRFGPRLVMTFALIVCGLGSLFFSQTTTVQFASLGRFLMGIGSACSFVGLLVLISRWFPAKYFALLAGVAQLMSSIGAIFGETTLASSVENFGWRSTMFWTAIIGFGLAALIWLVVRDYPKHHPAHGKCHTEKESEFKKLKTVLSNSQTWVVASYTFLVWSPIIVFAAMWGVPYTEQLYHLSPTQAGMLVSCVWIGIGIGSPLFGWVSDWMGSRCIPLAVTAVIGLLTTLFILYMQHISLYLYALLMFFFGIGASGQALSFAVVKENNTPENVGTASGFNNFATVFGGAVLQPLAGVMLTLAWDGKLHNAVPVYSVLAYRHALLILPICFSLAFFVSCFFLKETKCRTIFNRQNNNNLIETSV